MANLRLPPLVQTSHDLGIPYESDFAPIWYNQEQAAVIDDANDCIALIQGWLGARAAHENTRGILFRDVDRELGLKPGSAQQYIGAATRRWDYEIERAGPEVILLRSDPSF